MERERSVAGLTCSAVLAQLSAYVDDELAAPQREQLEAHVRGCDWCERFGGRFAAAIAQIRASLQPAPAPSQELLDALRARLARERGRTD